MADAPTAAIVLAAGASTRLGHPKQLVKLAGEALVRRAARLALEAECAPVLVVLGACDAPCRAALAGLEVTVLHNALWTAGMASTLRCGMASLSSMPHRPASVLLTVTDQVGLTAESLRSLLAAHAGHDGPATAAVYSGRLGVPAIFRRALFPALLALTGDQGARTLLAQLGSSAAGLPLPEAAADLDTPEDLAKLLL